MRSYLSANHCRLEYSVRTHNHFQSLLYTCLYHIPISACYLQRILIFHLLGFCLTRVTSRSRLWPPNMMYRVVLGQEFLLH
jgi:hypothetical protein